MQDIDIEAASKSWRNAPDDHITQAIKNLNDYDPRVGGIITEEAKKRFGETVVSETINKLMQQNKLKKDGGEKDQNIKQRTAFKWCLWFTLFAFVRPILYVFLRFDKLDIRSNEFLDMLAGAVGLTLITWTVYGLICLFSRRQVDE